MHDVLSRRRLLALWPLALAPGLAASQARPPITLVVPYPAGGAGDMMARAVAPALSAELGRPIVIENISGATGSIGATRALAAPPDGSVVFLGSPTETILAPLTLASVPYRPEHFRLIGVLSTAPLAVYARAGLPADTLDQLQALSAAPGAQALSFGSTGIGSLFHIVGSKMFQAAGIPVIHVPYRGGAPLVQNLLGGALDLTVLPVDGTVARLVEGGKIKVLAVSARSRSPRFPQAQVFAETRALREFDDHSVWAGLMVHRDTPAEVVQQLHAAMSRALQSHEARKALEAAGGAVASPASLAQASDFYAAQRSYLQGLVKSAGVIAQ